MDTNNPPELSNTKAALELREQELKVKELEIRIKDLKIPEYRRLNFWTSGVAVIVAVAGVIGQNILSNIKYEQAKLEMKEVEIKRDSAKKLVEEATFALEIARDSQRVAEQEFALQKLKIDSAQQSFALLSQKISELQKSTPDSAGSSRQLSSIKTIIRQSEAKLNAIPPRVYIHISGENQRSIAEQVQSGLSKQGFVVPGIENMEGKKSYSPPTTEVRYFKDTEREEALRIVQVFKNLDVKVKEQKVGGTNKNRPRHYEVWFSKP